MTRAPDVHSAAIGRARRGRRILVAAVVALFVGLALVGAHAMGYRLNRTTAHVAAPAVDASPEHVVTSYVEAYDARDWTTMALIYPSQTFDRHRAIGTMSDLAIVGSRALTSAEASAEYGNPAVPGHSYYEVQVTLDLTDLDGSDMAYRPGPNGWTYRLERSTTDEPWHITDHGNG